MPAHHDDTPDAPRGETPHAHGPQMLCTSDAPRSASGTDSHATTVHVQKHPMTRGITSEVGSKVLQERIWLRSLMLVNRLRVIRTIDLAAHNFAERPFKAALSAAQRAVRGMVKAGLLARYRTDRFMTVYGLTTRGALWLEDQGVQAVASVRRVTDMTNPEHRLWAQFLVVCAQARGLKAMTEPELLQALSRQAPVDGQSPAGLLPVAAKGPSRRQEAWLRPDAAAFESDGLTWFEVDRSARGSARASALRRLVLSVGASTTLGPVLRRVVVFTRTERIHNRVLATLKSLSVETESQSALTGRRRLVPTTPEQFEVWASVDEQLKDGRVRLVEKCVGHVMVQALPVHLPRVRMDGRGGYQASGWFDENALPYVKPPGQTWPPLRSPLTAR